MGYMSLHLSRNIRVKILVCNSITVLVICVRLCVCVCMRVCVCGGCVLYVPMSFSLLLQNS